MVEVEEIWTFTVRHSLYKVPTGPSMPVSSQLKYEANKVERGARHGVSRK